MPMTTEDAPLRSSRERNDLLDERSPRGVRVVQLVNEPGHWFNHIYMETPSVTPDGRRVVVSGFRAAETLAQDNARDIPRNFYLCDLEDERGIALRKLTDDGGLERAPSVSPDGRYLYYIVSRAQSKAGPVLFRRVNLETNRSEDLLTFDALLSGGLPCRQIYNLGTMSPDGERYATACCFGDPKHAGSPWGLLVVDLPSMTSYPVELGADYTNIHPQYCRSPHAPRDIMVQHNHADPPDKETTVRFSADVHVIRDDGTHWRGFPWGRDGREYCSGHQAWRGEQLSAVTSTGRLDTKDICQELVESFPVSQPDGGDHRGLRQDGLRNLLSRSVPKPRFSHFGFDRSGNRFVSDCRPDENTGVDEIILGCIPDGHDRALYWTHLISSHNLWRSEGHAHPHPFLSPAGDRVFFNSNEGEWGMGIFMVENLEYLSGQPSVCRRKAM